jgi:hypothetical protein
MKSLTKSTSPLGRPLDFSYRSNVLVVVVSALVSAAYAAAEFLFDLSPASSWWAAGGSVFLAWAIARELDPDHSGSAVAAMGVMAILAAAVQPPLLFAFGALTGLRLTAGTVGLPMKPTDYLSVIAIGGVVGLSDASLASALLLAAGVVVIGAAGGLAIAAAAAAVAATLTVTLAVGGGVQWAAPDGLGITLAAMATVALLLTVPARTGSATTDVGTSAVIASRVTLARWLAWGGVIIAFAIYGGNGLLAAAPLVAGSAGVACARIAMPLLELSQVRSEVGSR